MHRLVIYSWSPHNVGCVLYNWKICWDLRIPCCPGDDSYVPPFGIGPGTGPGGFCGFSNSSRMFVRTEYNSCNFRDERHTSPVNPETLRFPRLDSYGPETTCLIRVPRVRCEGPTPCRILKSVFVFEGRVFGLGLGHGLR